MKIAHINIGRLFLGTALFMLITGLLAGLLASFSYTSPALLKDIIGFSSLRPLHVSSVMLWILLGATGSVYSAMEIINPGKTPKALALVQWLLWVTAAAGILYSYFTKDFGGREYWEFNPRWAMLVGMAWALFTINFFFAVRKVKNWPAYLWMFMTGIVFFMYIFCENYLWMIPGLRQHPVSDITLQWKVNGSLVGAWNQLIYGSALFLMERIGKDRSTAMSRPAFLLFFLGLFNLIFNWGHHIYTLPTHHYVRYISYGVSMTEWLVFARIIYTWRKTYRRFQSQQENISYWFIMASDVWVFISVSQAILMSIPALNLYTHGTHITVAHAMGTTIGINSMILLACCVHFVGEERFQKQKKSLRLVYWLVQGGLGGLWLFLSIAGVHKGVWQMDPAHGSFQVMMQELQPWFTGFVISGALLAAALSILAFILLSRILSKGHDNVKNPQQTGSGRLQAADKYQSGLLQKKGQLTLNN